MSVPYDDVAPAISTSRSRAPTLSRKNHVRSPLSRRHVSATPGPWRLRFVGIPGVWRAFGRMLSIGPIKQDHSTMKHPLPSPAGHVRRRYNGNAPPPGVPLSAVPVCRIPIVSSRGLCEMTRRHRRRRINALQTSINTSQTVAESAGRDARALRVRRAGWGLTRVDRPAPAPGPPAPRACLVCASTVVSTSGDVARR